MLYHNIAYRACEKFKKNVFTSLKVKNKKYQKYVKSMIK